MIEAPAYLKTPQYRLYKDAHDSELFYVDALQPSAVHGGKTVNWQTSPDSDRACFVSEVQFGTTEAGFEQVKKLVKDYERTVPAPWESSPAYTWFKSPDRILVDGRSSGFGYHNAVMQGVASTGVISAPNVVAGELYFKAKLTGATLRANGSTIALQQALDHAPLGDRASWNATIADILIPILKELVEIEYFVIQAESVSLSIESLIELKELVLMEWASRIAQAVSIKSLALPASTVDSIVLNEIDFKIHWASGDLIPIRTVRSLCSEGISLPPKSKSEHLMKVSLSQDSDWSNFNYVQISTAKQSTTLTPDQPVQIIQVKASDSITAIANLKGYGINVPINLKVLGDQAIVHLQRLEEQTFLVKAERSLLEKVGDLHISISHPELFKILVPKNDQLILSASDGDLPIVSTVYRGLLQQAESVTPYTVQVQFESGVTAQWQDLPREGNIMIESAMLPLLKVMVTPQNNAAHNTVEVSQSSMQTSLGTKEISSDDFAIWSYSPAEPLLWIRTQYHGATQTPYWTAWHSATSESPVLAPRMQWRSIAIMTSPKLMEPLTIEIAPAIGEGGIAQVVVRSGEATSLKLIDDEQGGQLKYRTCNKSWSDWQVLNGNVLKL
jgi:hypothetical protein